MFKPDFIPRDDKFSFEYRGDPDQTKDSLIADVEHRMMKFHIKILAGHIRHTIDHSDYSDDAKGYLEEVWNHLNDILNPEE